MDPNSIEAKRALAKQAGFSDEQIQAYEQKALASTKPGGGWGAPAVTEEDSRRQMELVNPEASGAPFKVQAVDSLMRGLWEPEQRLNYMKKTFGEDKVRVSPGGDIIWSDEQGGEHPLSGKDFEPSDLGSIVGYLPELAGMVLGPLGRAKWLSRMKGAVVGGSAGELARQGLGIASSGESIPGEKSFQQLLRAGATAGVAQGAGEALGAVATAPTVNPVRLLAQAANKKTQQSEGSSFAKEMQGMQERQEFPLSFYQETGSDFAKMLEGFTGRTAFGRLAAEKLPHKQNMAAYARAQRFIELLGKRPEALADENVGLALAETGRKAVDDVLTGMQSTANEYFNFRSQVLGKDKNITPGNWMQTLRQRAEEYRHHGDTSSMKTAKALEAMAEDPAFAQGMSAATIQHKLAEYNARSYGKEGDKLFPTLDTAASVELTKKLHEALKRDLWEETTLLSEKPSLAPKGASIALRTGLKKYGEEAGLLDQLKTTPIVALLDQRGLLKRGAQNVGAEHIPQALREGMRTGKIAPSEMRNAIKLLQTTDPTMADTITGSVIQDAIVAGMEKGATQPWKFDREAFQQALPHPRYLEALYGDVWNKGAKTRGLQISKDLNELSQLIRRSAEKIGIGIPESPTTTIGAMVHRMLTAPTSVAGQASYKIFAPYEISKVMTDPKARKATAAWLNKVASTPAVAPASSGRAILGETARRGLPPAFQSGMSPGVGLQEEPSE